MKKTTSFGGLTIGITALLVGVASGHPPRDSRAEPILFHGVQENGSAKPPVVLELFTSEGCSSCPPADVLLSDLQNKPIIGGTDVIAFEEHVDYWNSGGWNDAFSSHQWTQRQADYQAAFGRSPAGIYTPQLVVDGNHEVIGSNAANVLALVMAESKQPKISVKIAPAASQKGMQAFTVTAGSATDSALPADAEVFLAVTETGLHSSVTAGENSGKALQHAAVLRRMEKIGAIRAKSNTFSRDAKVKFES
ncbi:MAG TPA: DUF1223 domain-containing protein [Candidatus Dormibacteraeota bacterium]|nr:DUF1223 domain-containing protein [Candidatus Dormibacteraeota bacterium]